MLQKEIKRNTALKQKKITLSVHEDTDYGGLPVETGTSCTRENRSVWTSPLGPVSYPFHGHHRKVIPAPAWNPARKNQSFIKNSSSFFHMGGAGVVFALERAHEPGRLTSNDQSTKGLVSPKASPRQHATLTAKTVTNQTYA